MFVECQNVGSVMTFKSYLNVTACVVKMFNLGNCVKALTKASRALKECAYCMTVL